MLGFVFYFVKVMVVRVKQGSVLAEELKRGLGKRMDSWGPLVPRVLFNTISRVVGTFARNVPYFIG